MRMKKSTNTVWKMPYRKTYYLTHPWIWVGQAISNIRAAYMRTHYGWCYGDVWNIDQWIMNTLPPMLRHVAENGMSYPIEFESVERWHKWLNAMADLLESGFEENQNNCNEYYNEYVAHIGDPSELRVTEMNRDYYRRAQEIGEDAADNVAYAMQQLGKYFFDLQD